MPKLYSTLQDPWTSPCDERKLNMVEYTLCLDSSGERGNEIDFVEDLRISSKSVCMLIKRERKKRGVNEGQGLQVLLLNWPA